MNSWIFGLILTAGVSFIGILYGMVAYVRKRCQRSNIAKYDTLGIDPIDTDDARVIEINAINNEWDDVGTNRANVNETLEDAQGLKMKDTIDHSRNDNIDETKNLMPLNSDIVTDFSNDYVTIINGNSNSSESHHIATMNEKNINDSKPKMDTIHASIISESKSKDSNAIPMPNSLCDHKNAEQYSDTIKSDASMADLSMMNNSNNNNTRTQSDLTMIDLANEININNNSNGNNKYNNNSNNINNIGSIGNNSSNNDNRNYYLQVTTPNKTQKEMATRSAPKKSKTKQKERNNISEKRVDDIGECKEQQESELIYILKEKAANIGEESLETFKQRVGFDVMRRCLLMPEHSEHRTEYLPLKYLSHIKHATLHRECEKGCEKFFEHCLKPTQELPVPSEDIASKIKFSNEKLYKFKDFWIEKTIATTNLSHVFSAFYINDDQKRLIQVALKVCGPKVCLTSEYEDLCFMSEANISLSLTLNDLKRIMLDGETGVHGHCAGFFCESDYRVLVFEYMADTIGNFFKRMIDRNLKYRELWGPDDTRLQISYLKCQFYLCTAFLQLLSVLDDLHSQGFLHRDIKPPNVMLQYFPWECKYDDWILKYKRTRWESNVLFMLKWCCIDCNISFGKEDPARGRTSVGTNGYLASEQLQREPYTKESDYAQLGLSALCTLLNNRPSPIDRTTDDLATKTAIAEYNQTIDNHANLWLQDIREKYGKEEGDIREGLWNAVKILTDVDPKKRNIETVKTNLMRIYEKCVRDLGSHGISVLQQQL